jgi:hypothetical protein
MKTSYKHTTFTQMKADHPEDEGLVIMGCEIGEDPESWVRTISKFLYDHKVMVTPEFTDHFLPEIPVLTTTGGRVDIVFMFSHNTKLNIGRFAVVRLQMPDASWLSDYFVNYTTQHGEEAPEDDDIEDDEV